MTLWLFVLACEPPSKDHSTVAPLPRAVPPTDSSSRVSSGAPAVPGGRPPRAAYAAQGAAVVDTHSLAGAPKNCLIRHACSKVRALPSCHSVVATEIDALLAGRLEAQLGAELVVRGELGISLGLTTLRGCLGNVCCNEGRASIRLGRVPNRIELEGLGCTGDESRLCCNVPAFGQVVIARGRLQNATSETARLDGVRWQLAQVSLCEETKP